MFFIPLIMLKVFDPNLAWSCFSLVLFVQSQTLGQIFQFGWMHAFKMGAKKG
jgi:hypothetical protein